MKKKRMWKRVLCMLLALCFCVEYAPITKAASKDKVTIAKFAAALEEAVGKEGVLKEGEYPDTSKNITWADAAVLTSRADELKNGTSYNKDLYAQVKEKKRIAGLSQIPKSKVSAVRKCFVKGIIVGDNNGRYSQNRKFRGNDAITQAEAETILARLKSKKKRVKLSPDGQVIRTTNLPKNYKKYDYILESFPNSFYEKRFYYQLVTYYAKPVNLDDYACPKDMKRVEYEFWSGQKGNYWDDIIQPNLDDWCKKIETNLKTRLSFDYRTVNNKWMNKVRKTYRKGMDAEQDKEYMDDIKAYVKRAKKNKVVIKYSKVVVEPSTLYKEGGDKYIRCYVKFKLSADKVYSSGVKQDELIFNQRGNNVPGLKKNKWVEMVVDVSVGMSYMGDMGQDYGLQNDWIWEWK